MFKKSIITICYVCVISMACGCSYLGSKAEKNIPTGREQICNELSRDITLDKSNADINIRQESVTEQARMMKDYSKNKCGSIQKN